MAKDLTLWVSPQSACKQRYEIGRVTRLGEFSPIGRLFTLGSFLKITKVAHIFGASFFPRKKGCVDFSKKWLGLHFERIFQKLIWST
jgi:hypothetical protein